MDEGYWGPLGVKSRSAWGKNYQGFRHGGASGQALVSRPFGERKVKDEKKISRGTTPS